MTGDLVITELLADPNGVDAGAEYLEIFNATSVDVELEGVRLFHAGAEGSGERSVRLSAARVAAGSYFVLGHALGSERPAYLDSSYGEALGALRDDRGKLGLACGEHSVDEVVYVGVTPGHALELDGALVPDSTVNDQEGNWCNASALLEGPAPSQRFGSPGAQNPPCSELGAALCADSVLGRERPIVAPAVGDLVITEVMADPAATADGDGEWFEIFARAALDLNGLSVRSGTGRSALSAASCLHVDAGGYALLMRSVAPAQSGEFPGAVFAQRLSLPNRAASLSIESAQALLDEVSWSSVESGVALQLSASALAAEPEERSRAWCLAMTPYATGDKGTPGMPNQPCSAAPSSSGSDGSSGGSSSGGSVGGSSGKGGSGGASALACLDASNGSMREPKLPAEGDLVISEVMANPAAVTDAQGEWFELFARNDLDLNGLTLRAGSSVSTLASPSCLRVAAGSYAVVSRNPAAESNGELPPVSGTLPLTLPNGASSLSLEIGATVIDEVAWPSSKAGSAWQLDRDALVAARLERTQAYCLATEAYGRGDKGTPSMPNSPCDLAPSSEGGNPSGQCLDPHSGQARDVVAAGPGDLRISEVMAAPLRGNAGGGEWFEIFAVADVDLNGLVLANEGAGSSLLEEPHCMRVAAGEHLLFARSDDAAQNGGLPPVLATFSFGLADSAGNDPSERAVVLRLAETELDRVSWATSSRGVSRQLSRDPLAQEVGEPAVWCLAPAIATFGDGQRGTPGLENLSCK